MTRTGKINKVSLPCLYCDYKGTPDGSDKCLYCGKVLESPVNTEDGKARYEICQILAGAEGFVFDHANIKSPSMNICLNQVIDDSNRCSDFSLELTHIVQKYGYIVIGVKKATKYGYNKLFFYMEHLKQTMEAVDHMAIYDKELTAAERKELEVKAKETIMKHLPDSITEKQKEKVKKSLDELQLCGKYKSTKKERKN